MARPFPFNYSSSASNRGWGSGWPACGGAKSAGVVTVIAGNSGARFGVHSRIARLVDLIVDECARRGYVFHRPQCGGYNCRAIGGTRRPSNHSWALAIDINWQINPMKRPLTTNIPRWMIDLFEEYGFAWGGNYSGTPDTMHFEFMGTPAQADQMLTKALRNIGGGGVITPPAPNTPRPPGVAVLKRGVKHPDNIRWQKFVNKMYTRFRPALIEDGDFGNKTHQRTVEIQRFLRIMVDGEVGPQTRTRTGFR